MMGNIASKLRGHTTSERNLDIDHRFPKHRRDVIKCLPVDLTGLISKGIELHLIDILDVAEDFTRDDKIDKILDSVEHKVNGYSKFLQCIKSEKDEHMGYQYIESLLESKHFADKSEIDKSMEYRRKIFDNMSKMRDISLKELCPLLLQERLISIDELESLTDTTRLTKPERNMLLFHILETKGPTAHLQFVHCLGEETSHTCHRELFQLLCGQLDEQVAVPSRKRKGADICMKRTPQNLTMHGVLTTEKYARSVRSWRKWVSNGEWNHTESTERKYMQELHIHPLAETVTNLLQSVFARIVRKEYLKAEELLSLCDNLCSEVTGDNNTILRGRCKYTWSWLFRYKKQLKHAKAHAEEAMLILFNVSPGEDKALANYGYASSLIDYHATVESPDPKEIKSAEESLRFAIGCAQIEDRGLEHIVPHSHLRLAQMYLGSTHFEPGKNSDTESIRKAGDCLQAIHLGAILPRSKCIFYLTESDLYRCKGMMTKARESARSALKIAQDNSFKTEITAAQTKLQSL